jgi:hypothetical protein
MAKTTERHMPKRDKSPDESGPVTLQQFHDQDLGLRPYCPCGHTTIIPPKALAQWPGTMLLEALKARLTCGRCGRTGIESAQVVSMAALGAYPRG